MTRFNSVLCKINACRGSGGILPQGRADPLRSLLVKIPTKYQPEFLRVLLLHLHVRRLVT